MKLSQKSTPIIPPPAYQAHHLKVAISPQLNTEAMSFKIPAQQLTCIIGKNGSGKTTLLKGLAGLAKFSSGTLLYYANDISQIDPKVRCAQIAWCPESIDLPPQFSVRESIALGLYPQQRRAPNAHDVHKVDQVAKQHGLTSLLHRPTHSLSNGEHRKVSLLRGLVQHPQTLLLDEPTAGLDPAAISYLMHTLKHLTHTGMTVVCVLHQIHLASAFGDHIIALNNRSLYQSQPTAEFFSATTHLSQLFQLPSTTVTTTDTTVHHLDYLATPPPHFY